MLARLGLVLVLAVSLNLTACGELDDAKEKGKQAVEDVKKKAKEGVEAAKEKAREGIAAAKREGAKIEAKFNEVREDVASRVNEVLARIEGVFPRADEDTPVPSLRAADTFGGFTFATMRNVGRYWKRTFRANDIQRPRVRYEFVSAGRRMSTRCGNAADDQAAFYCPADDTIYFGEGIGRQIYDNLGDFGVAYALAHEWAHNVQQELGWFAQGRGLTTVAPFELQADCMAGTWAYAVYQRGRIDDNDVAEAVNTAYAVGDFDINNPQHHGTPRQRARAWLRGYDSGDPSRCTLRLG